MRRVLALSTRFPRAVIAAWVILFVIGGILALRLDAALSGGGFSNPRAEALMTQQVVQDRFGESPNQLVIVLDGEGALSDAAISDTAAVLEEEGADSVLTPATNTELISSDGRTAALIAGFDGSGTAVQNLVPDLQARMSDSGLAENIYVTGQPALDFQLNAHSKADALRAELIVAPLLIIVLLLVFRSVIAALLPLLVAGSSLVISLGIGYVATQFTEVSNLYTNIVSMIGLAVAVDYSLFIIKRFREELDAGKTTTQAVQIAMATAGHSVLFSGIAVVLALAALLIPRVMALTSIALGGIVVSIVALFITMVVLPAALTLLGARINRLQVPFLKNASSSTVKSTETTKIRRPGLVGVAGVVVLAACAIPVSGLSLQSPVASATVLPASDPARQGLETLEQRVGQEDLFPVDVVLTMPKTTSTADAITDVDRASSWLTDRAGVDSVTSISTIGLPPEQLTAALAQPALPEDLRQLWSTDGDTITARLLTITTDGPDSVSAHELVADIRSNLPTALDSNVDVAVTGATAQGYDFDTTLVQSIPLILGLVILLTFIMLAFAWRSAILPALALLFNLLVVGASVGALTLIQQATSDDPLNSVTPILLFAVMFGLSMDYMVIIMSRMRELYRSGMPYEQAVLAGAHRTRSMINSAAIIMIAVFLSFMTAQISIVREIGIGLAIAVALDAVVIRMIVMPSVLRAIGPRAFGTKRASAAPPASATTAASGSPAEAVRPNDDLVGV
ncbi:MMPL family transporter [Clavibacter sp. Sh2088]|uniref:MMPL family transporter n=1 Tax=Clavibacter sp. Sh2088 TaxID=3397676 RepID=UPI0039E12234